MRYKKKIRVLIISFEILKQESRVDRDEVIR